MRNFEERHGWYKGRLWTAFIVNPEDVQHEEKIRLRNGDMDLIGINMAFYDPGSMIPISIVIKNGKIIREASCHEYVDEKYTATAHKPEGVIGFDGKRVFYQRARFASEILRKHPETVWAVGGASMGKMFNPSAEGFVSPFDDPFRKTNHNGTWLKDGAIWLMTYHNMNGDHINGLSEKMKTDISILGDGGHACVSSGTNLLMSCGRKSFVSASALTIRRD